MYGTIQRKTYSPKRVRPYTALQAEVDSLTPDVMSGRVFLNDLPKAGKYVTIRWHAHNMKYITTHEVVTIDEEKSGDMMLRCHWKGWIEND